MPTHKKLRENLKSNKENSIKDNLVFNKKEMFKQIIDYIISIFLRHKAVFNCRYMQRIYTNSQNNNAYVQAIINSDPYIQALISVANRPTTLTLNIDILAFKTNEYTVVDAQSDTLQIGMEVIHFIEQDPYFMGRLSVHDFSFLGLDEYTDDRAAGQRLTIELIVPDVTNLCTFKDNFLDEPKIIETEDKEIELTDVNPPSKANDLVLRPVLIPHK